jgi:hypothetical protein
VPIELGHLNPDPQGNYDTAAVAANNDGLVVGTSTSYAGGINRAVATLWLPDGTGIDLNSLATNLSGWTLTQALTNTDSGWITGIGQFDPDGPGGAFRYGRAWLMQVPEPASSALVLGMMFLAGRRRSLSAFKQRSTTFISLFSSRRHVPDGKVNLNAKTIRRALPSSGLSPLDSSCGCDR